MRKFTAPLHWDIEYLRAMAKIQNSSAQVVELYGCLNYYELPNGRIPLAHQNISIPEAQNIRKTLREYGSSFAYLVNGPLAKTAQKASDLASPLTKMMADLEPDAVVISEPQIGRVIRDINSTIPIHISSIASVETINDLERFKEVKPHRLILAHDVPKDEGKLISLLGHCQASGMEVECMVTESCLYRCPLKAQHYAAIASGRDDSEFHAYCLKQRLSDPRKFLEAGSFLRPQDLFRYDDLGINIYKISGRSKGLEWLLNTIRIYLSGHYEGDLLEIMGISTKNREHIPFEVPCHSINPADTSLTTTYQQIQPKSPSPGFNQ